MRLLISASLIALTLLTGCARRYVIITSNGSRITTRGKPERQGSVYVFKDSAGNAGQISILRVREITPASMAGNKSSSGFKVETKK